MENITTAVIELVKKNEEYSQTKNGIRLYISENDFKKERFENGFISIEDGNLDFMFSDKKLVKAELKKIEFGKTFDIERYVLDMVKAFKDEDFKIERFSSYWYSEGDVITKEVEVEKQVTSPVNEYYRGKSEVLDELLSRDVIELKK